MMKLSERKSSAYLDMNIHKNKALIRINKNLGFKD